MPSSLDTGVSDIVDPMAVMSDDEIPSEGDDRRYSLELVWMDGRCGTRIAVCRILFENIELML
ncbi:hypothetical protein Hanom_Chr02g00134521 [Helianthus anomalus]